MNSNAHSRIIFFLSIFNLFGKSDLIRPSSNALSFYRAKMILDRYKLFWLGLNHFCQVQIKLFQAIFYNLDLSKIILTRPKRIGPVQNNWYLTKRIWTVQNHFGSIEGQGTRLLKLRLSNYGQKNIFFPSACVDLSISDFKTQI